MINKKPRIIEMNGGVFQLLVIICNSKVQQKINLKIIFLINLINLTLVKINTKHGKTQKLRFGIH